MPHSEQVTLPAVELKRLLLLSQFMLAVVEGIGEQNEEILTARLKGILPSKQRDIMSAMIEDFDNLLVAHIAYDLIKSTTEVAGYLPEFNSSTVVKLKVMQ